MFGAEVALPADGVFVRAVLGGTVPDGVDLALDGAEPAREETVLSIPVGEATPNFRLRWRGLEPVDTFKIEVFDEDAGTLVLDGGLNRVLAVGGLRFAVRANAQEWDPSVLAGRHAQAVRPPARARLRLALAALGTLLILSGVGLAVLHYERAQRVQTVSAVLAPLDCAVLGSGGEIDVIAADAETAASAQRALQHIEAKDVTVRLRAAEVARARRILVRAHIEPIAVRLSEPREPVVVLTDARHSSEAQRLLRAALPYARSIAVRVVDLNGIVDSARAVLEPLGVHARIEARRDRLDIGIDDHVDDAQLAGLGAGLARLRDEWGADYVHAVIRQREAVRFGGVLAGPEGFAWRAPRDIYFPS